jgi:UDP-N-acetyl-2-amino-2-deoxyglucuronate dehydrogenase
MATAVKVAFVGAGRVAQHHCKMLSEVREVELIAISDLRADRGKPLADQYSVPWYENYHEMFAKHPDIDLVTVATPSGMHFEHAKEIIERYSKSIIVEKPTFMTPLQMKDAYEIADRHGVKIFPVYQNRYNKAVDRVRHAVRSGELGKIQMASVRMRWCRQQAYYDRDPWRGTWSHDGGALTNQGVHYIDLLRHLGGEIDLVDARMATLGVEVEVEDTVAATFRFKDGGLGVIEVTTAARPRDFEASISLVGSKGMAVISGEATNHLIEFTPDPDACSKSSEDFPIIYGFGHREMYRDIANVLIRGTEPPVTLQDGMQTLEFLHGLYCSAESGKAVSVGDGFCSTRLGRPNEAVSTLYRTPMHVTAP